jgi:hypothetical protein
MTERNEKSINFHEFLSLRRDRECRVNRINFRRSQVNFKCCDLDFNRFNHLRKVLQNQNKQVQNFNDHEKSIKMQRQEFFERRDQREKRVKIFEELIQFV